ncbi:MAG: DUF523 domain-containing protein [Eubacteriales bacterium]|nr:DUF523 domain-containing protein [Eubacteriales bacterium]
MFIISACLLGMDCKYNGGNNRNEAVIRFAETHSHVVVCPETAGGLERPRPPAERQGDRIVNKEGLDVTEYFRRGAELSLKKVLEESERSGEPIEGAILKANSPSCGSGMIYDGSFTGNKVPGDGCFTELLKARGIEVLTEKNLVESGDFPADAK